MNTHTRLEKWRKQIDALDEALLSLLVKRIEIVREIGIYKKQNGLAAVDSKRWESLLTKLMSKAKDLGINPNFVKKIWNTIHEHELTIEQI